MSFFTSENENNLTYFKNNHFVIRFFFITFITDPSLDGRKAIIAY